MLALSRDDRYKRVNKDRKPSDHGTYRMLNKRTIQSIWILREATKMLGYAKSFALSVPDRILHYFHAYVYRITRTESGGLHRVQP